MFNQRMQQTLSERKAQSLFRQRYASNPHTNTIHVNDQTYLNFSGNDYLGLSQHTAIKNAFVEGVQDYGTGSTGSALINGYHVAHQNLEEKLAEWLGYERVVLFSTGFSANATVLKTLFNDRDLIIQDKLNHASLIDGGLASPACNVRFNHNDINHLEQRLSRAAEVKCVVTEGVFSMDGDSAPFTEIATQCASHDALLMIDDAHGIGAMGTEGRGSWHESGTQPDILMSTFGKAFGLSGAFVAGSALLIDYLIQYARSYIYSTALPPALACAASKAIDVIKSEQWRRDKLQENIQHFRASLTGYQQANEYPLLNSQSAIQPIIIGAAEQAVTLANHLRDQGIWVTAIRPPTVPVNSSRLRITLSAEHSFDEINRLTSTIKQFSNAC